MTIDYIIAALCGAAIGYIFSLALEQHFIKTDENTIYVTLRTELNQDGIFYAYSEGPDSNKFICQGRTKAQLLDAFSLRFPDYKMVIQNEKAIGLPDVDKSF